MRLKKRLLLMLIVVLLLQPAYGIADNESVLAIEPTEGTVYMPGETFSVDVSLSALTDDVYMFQFAIEYDPEILILENSIPGDFFSTAGTPTINSSIPGVLYINWDSINVPITTDCLLLRMWFTVRETEATETTIGFSKTDEIICANWDRALDLTFGEAVIMLSPFYGDTNCDGKITAVDAAAVLRSIVGLSVLNERQVLNADVDGIKGITAEDAVVILRYVVGLINRFPVSISIGS